MASAWIGGVVRPAAAQNVVSDQVDDLRNAFGLGRERAPIDFADRPPLVVPPSYTLPPPGQGDPTLGVNDPDVIARRRALTDSRRPVPPTDPGANAQGYQSRAYLVDPPSGMRDPDAAAGTTDHSTGATLTPVRKQHVRKKARTAVSAQ